MSKLSSILIGVFAVLFVGFFGLLTLFGGASVFIDETEKIENEITSTEEEKDDDGFKGNEDEEVEEFSTVDEIVDHLNGTSEADGYYTSTDYDGEEMILFIIDSKTEEELVKYALDNNAPLTRFSKLEAELEEASSYAYGASGENIVVSVQNPLNEENILMSAAGGVVYYDFRY